MVVEDNEHVFINLFVVNHAVRQQEAIVKCMCSLFIVLDICTVINR